jgi:hypothetical protein
VVAAELALMALEVARHPTTNRTNVAQLTSHAADCVLSCQTRIGLIDDIHFIDPPMRKDGPDVSDHPTESTSTKPPSRHTAT